MIFYFYWNREIEYLWNVLQSPIREIKYPQNVFFSKCGIKQPRNLIPLKYKSFLFSDLYIYSFCYDKDLLYNHGVIKLHDIIQSKKKKKDLAKVFFTQKWTFFLLTKIFLQNFSQKPSFVKIGVKIFCIFSIPQKASARENFSP